MLADCRRKDSSSKSHKCVLVGWCWWCNFSLLYNLVGLCGLEWGFVSWLLQSPLFLGFLCWYYWSSVTWNKFVIVIGRKMGSGNTDPSTSLCYTFKLSLCKTLCCSFKCLLVSFHHSSVLFFRSRKLLFSLIYLV